MKDHKMPMIVILEMKAGIDLIENNVDISPSTAYKVAGILGSKVEQFKKRYDRRYTVLAQGYNNERKALVGKLLDNEFSEELKSTLTDLANKFNENVQELNFQEESLRVPELSLNDFVAKEEVKRYITVKDKDNTERTEILIIKAGNLLVPAGFFKYFGDLIAE